MKIALFERTLHPLSLLISWVTKSKYSHAALVTSEGHVFEALETKGVVLDSGPLTNYGRRMVKVWEVKDEDRLGITWAATQIGEQYDYKGVLGYIWAENDRKRFYCFEYVLDALFISKACPMPVRRRNNAWDIIKWMEITKAPVVFDGQAKDYKGGT